MKYLIGIAVAVLVIFAFMHYPRDKFDPKNRPIIMAAPDKSYKYAGEPLGSVYETTKVTGKDVKDGSKMCSRLCLEDKNCDSWTYDLDNMCHKRQLATANDSLVFWKTKDALLKVPGKRLQNGLLKEKILDNSDACAKTCMSDGSCLVSSYDESTKSCKYGSAIASGDNLSGIIPARRTAVDLAGN